MGESIKRDYSDASNHKGVDLYLSTLEEKKPFASGVGLTDT